MSKPARDLLRQLSATSTQLEIKQERPSTHNGSDEIELSLGLSLNGSFGVDPSKKTKLIRSSSVACFAPAEIERPLVRMSSLPSEELQVLKRLEAKRKRLERRNSLNKNGGEKCEEELVPKRRKVEGESENLPNGLLTDRVDLNNGSVSQGSSSSFDFAGVDAKQIQDKMAVLTNCTEKKSVNSSLQTSINDHLQPEHKRSSSISPSPSLLTGIPNPGKRIPGRAHSFSVVERNMLHEMPCVSTKGEGPNGKKVDGFLYKYNKGEEVRIVCVCHGRFLTPAEFVRHAGGGEVAHPLRHITVNASPTTFA